jgi:hypothetical protein
MPADPLKLGVDGGEGNDAILGGYGVSRALRSFIFATCRGTGADSYRPRMRLALPSERPGPRRAQRLPGL